MENSINTPFFTITTKIIMNKIHLIVYEFKIKYLSPILIVATLLFCYQYVIAVLFLMFISLSLHLCKCYLKKKEKKTAKPDTRIIQLTDVTKPFDFDKIYQNILRYQKKIHWWNRQLSVYQVQLSIHGMTVLLVVLDYLQKS